MFVLCVAVSGAMFRSLKQRLVSFTPLLFADPPPGRCGGACWLRGEISFAPCANERLQYYSTMATIVLQYYGDYSTIATIVSSSKSVQKVNCAECKIGPGVFCLTGFQCLICLDSSVFSHHFPGMEVFGYFPRCVSQICGCSPVCGCCSYLRQSVSPASKLVNK